VGHHSSSLHLIRVGAALGLALMITAGESSTAQTPTFKSGVDLVPLTVTVTDNSGKYVRGLTEDNFVILEDGIQQPLSFFASSDVPVDVALVIDTSASMRGDLPLVQAAATGLVRALGPEDRGAVMSVNDRAGVPQPFTNDRAIVEDAVRKLTTSGSTALYDGLYVMLKEFQRERRNVPQVRRQVLVLLTDGLDNKSRLAFDDVLEQARRADVNIYVIALKGQMPIVSRAQADGLLMNAEYAMNTVARDTGGRIFFPRTARELPAIYKAIAQELESQYELGYMPVRAARDGAFRRVSVRVASVENARARTRSGYYVR
jgi:Ca-activated chloride channel family protein